MGSEDKSVAVLIGGLERIRKGLGQNCQLLPGQRSAIELEKVSLMSTAHVMR